MKPREHFGGRAAVIMALAGSAIGLGNIWRFPYMVGENGGAAFILVYILATLLLLLPMFLAESVIGRRSRANAFGAMKALAPHSRWKWTGLFVVITPMIVLSYYSVVGGWALGYFGMSLTGGFLQSDPEALHGVFGSFLDSSWKPVVCFTAFLAISCLIVAGGVKSGIEKFSKYSIPVLFLMIVTMAVFSLSLPGAAEGVRYLIRPDFSKLTASAVAAAVGQGFFSLSLGMGIVITYSSYVKPTENLVASGLGTAVADLLFALLAGFAVMPAVFAAGIEPAAGPGLVFETLPYIFAKMGVELPLLSAVAAFLFFAALLIAALTSSISLAEVGVAYLVEEKGLKRGWACLLTFLVTWLLGLCCVFGPGVLDFLDSFSSNVLMTLGGLLCVVFVGWIMPRQDVQDELTNGGTVNRRAFRLLYFLMRYLAPLAVLSIFLSNLVW